MDLESCFEETKEPDIGAELPTGSGCKGGVLLFPQSCQNELQNSFVNQKTPLKAKYKGVPKEPKLQVKMSDMPGFSQINESNLSTDEDDDDMISEFQSIMSDFAALLAKKKSKKKNKEFERSKRSSMLLEQAVETPIVPDPPHEIEETCEVTPPPEPVTAMPAPPPMPEMYVSPVVVIPTKNGGDDALAEEEQGSKIDPFLAEITKKLEGGLPKLKRSQSTNTSPSPKPENSHIVDFRSRLKQSSKPKCRDTTNNEVTTGSLPFNLEKQKLAVPDGVSPTCSTPLETPFEELRKFQFKNKNVATKVGKAPTPPVTENDKNSSSKEAEGNRWKGNLRKSTNGKVAETPNDNNILKVLNTVQLKPCKDVKESEPKTIEKAPSSRPPPVAKKQQPAEPDQMVPDGKKETKAILPFHRVPILPPKPNFSATAEKMENLILPVETKEADQDIHQNAPVVPIEKEVKNDKLKEQVVPLPPPVPPPPPPQSLISPPVQTNKTVITKKDKVSSETDDNDTRDKLMDQIRQFAKNLRPIGTSNLNSRMRQPVDDLRSIMAKVAANMRPSIDSSEDSDTDEEDTWDIEDSDHDQMVPCV